MSSARPRPGNPQAQRDPDKTDPNAYVPALDPGADSLFVEHADDATVAHDGGPIGRAASKMKLVVLAGPKAGATFPIKAEQTIVGRSDDADVSIPDVSVSRRHANFVRQDDGSFLVSDLGSGNGTHINGVRVTMDFARHGDEIALGDTVLQLIDENAPPLPKGRSKTPAVVSGEQATGHASTRFDQQKVPAAASAPARAPSASVEQKAPGANKRMRLYAIAGGVLVVFLLLGIVAKARRGGEQEERTPRRGVATEGAALFRDAKNLAFNHQWTEAVRKAESALELSDDDPALHAFLEQARTEAEHQKRVGEARERLQSRDFATARTLLAKVPREADVYPQARTLNDELDSALARAVADATALADTDKDAAKELVAKVLTAEPANAQALALQERLERPEAPQRANVKPASAPSRPSTPAPTPAAQPPAARPEQTAVASAAYEAYRAGDLPRALRLAEDDGDNALMKKLRSFDENYRQGMQLAQQERAAEAVKALGLAASIDRELASGKSSKPGQQLKAQLANMEYLLGIYCKGDEGLPCATRHFRAALAADPGHDLASRQLARTEARAREIYTEAYVMKGSSPDRALKLFKISRDSLLPADETHQKADRWYKNLGGL